MSAIIPEVFLKRGKERAMLNRHPWVFSGAVAKQPDGVEMGDIVCLKESDGKRVGYGFYAPNTQIVCKVFEFTANECILDSDYWKNKLCRAIELRKQYVLNAETDACRLVFSEADYLPGLIVDQYGDVIVLQVLTRGMEKLLDVFVSSLHSCDYKHIYIRTKDATERMEGVHGNSHWIGDKPTAPILMREHGMTLEVDVEQGQKTGMFLDQRENRHLVRHYSKGKTVLNAFAYTGGFTVSALMGGATAVDSVDISEDALACCDRNVARNTYASPPVHKSVRTDCFDYLRSTQTAYDLIVLDPPAFAKNSKAMDAAARGYKDLNLIAFRNLRPSGILFTFSCSRSIDKELFRKIVFSAASDAGRNVRILHQLTQPIDHPINICHPEGEYLKGLVLFVE